MRRCRRASDGHDLVDERLVVACPRDIRWCRGTIALKQLKGQPFIMHRTCMASIFTTGDGIFPATSTRQITQYLDQSPQSCRGCGRAGIGILRPRRSASLRHVEVRHLSAWWRRRMSMDGTGPGKSASPRSGSWQSITCQTTARGGRHNYRRHRNNGIRNTPGPRLALALPTPHRHAQSNGTIYGIARSHSRRTRRRREKSPAHSGAGQHRHGSD